MLETARSMIVSFGTMGVGSPVSTTSSSGLIDMAGTLSALRKLFHPPQKSSDAPSDTYSVASADLPNLEDLQVQ